jgi:hypothetical protein
MRFSPTDRDTLQRIDFDPTAEPSFEIMKACLVWPDERPERISSEGFELLGDLWIVRGFVHRQVPGQLAAEPQLQVEWSLPNAGEVLTKVRTRTRVTAGVYREGYSATDGLGRALGAVA